MKVGRSRSLVFVGLSLLTVMMFVGCSTGGSLPGPIVSGTITLPAELTYNGTTAVTTGIYPLYVVAIKEGTPEPEPDSTGEIPFSGFSGSTVKIYVPYVSTSSWDVPYQIQLDDSGNYAFGALLDVNDNGSVPFTDEGGPVEPFGQYIVGGGNELTVVTVDKDTGGIDMTMQNGDSN